MSNNNNNSSNNNGNRAPQMTVPKISAAIEKFCKNTADTNNNINTFSAQNISINQSFSIGELKKNGGTAAPAGSSSSKFNDENLIKQRARESLKFWKEEEEKRKSEMNSQSLNTNNYNTLNSQSQNNSLLSNSVVSNTTTNNSQSHLSTNHHQDHSNHTNDIKTTADFSFASSTNNNTSNIDLSTSTAACGTVSKRVKDRINIFESKTQQQAGSSSTPSNHMNSSSPFKNFRKNFSKQSSAPLSLSNACDTNTYSENTFSKLEKKNSTPASMMLQSDIVTSSTIINIAKPLNSIQSKIDSFERKITDKRLDNSYSDLMKNQEDHYEEGQTTTATSDKKLIEEQNTIYDHISTTNNYEYDDDDDEEIKYEEVEFHYEVPKQQIYEYRQEEEGSSSPSQPPQQQEEEMVKNIESTARRSAVKIPITFSSSVRLDKTCYQEDAIVCPNKSSSSFCHRRKQISIENLQEQQNQESDEILSEEKREIEEIHQELTKSETNLYDEVGEVDEEEAEKGEGEEEEDEPNSQQSELEEVEIVIDLNKKQPQQQPTVTEHSAFKNNSHVENDEKKLIEYRHKMINETLKNIVMHVVPITRKAYVDDIVNGIKTLISFDQLLNVNSTIDLPQNVLRFIQKRYNNLLLEESYANNLPSNLSNVTSSSSSVSSSSASSENKEVIEEALTPAAAAPTTTTTTELTIVKDIRKEIFSSSESSSDSLNEHDDYKQQQNQNQDIMKVEEDTLYIVEQRRPILAVSNHLDDQISSEESNPTTTTNTTQYIVDNCIRKNFELKPKETEIDFDTNEDVNKPSSSNQKIFKMNSKFERIIDDLQLSIERINFLNDINDYQLHFFNDYHHKQSNHQNPLSLLVMLFDKQNEENFRFNLEKTYQKSIIDTHLVSNQIKEINIIANLNVYFINDIDFSVFDFGQCDINYLIERSKFDKFSLIKTFNNIDKQNATLSSNSKLPIGKHFVCVKYKHLLYTTDSNLNEILFKEVNMEKESIIDLSLLPLAIRAQFKHIFESISVISEDEETAAAPLPELNMVALDSYLVQLEINRKRDELIREGIIKNSKNPLDVKILLSKNLFNEIPDLDRIMKKIEMDLSSYYICEKCTDLKILLKNYYAQISNEENAQASLNEEDLVKLNKIDALASFKCVQKYKQLICEQVFDLVKSNSSSAGITDSLLNRFYLIDNGCHYKCIIPSKDIVSDDETSSQYQQQQYILDDINSCSMSDEDQFIANVNASSTTTQIDDLNNQQQSAEQNNNNNNASIAIESIQKRQNYIFNKDLMNVLTTTSGTSSRASVAACKQHQQQNSDDYFSQDDSQSFSNTRKIYSNENINETLPNLSSNSMQSQTPQKLINELIIRETLRDVSKQSVTEKSTKSTKSKKSTSSSIAEQPSASLKLFTDKETPDKIIVQEIDRMFSSIRDHQSACSKAKGECTMNCRKKYATWGYSSGKRHVKAKIMELPYVEDLNSLTKKVGIINTSAREQNLVSNEEDCVFVRIDDFITQDISHLLQRSYSSEYLNVSSGPRTRIKFLKIPNFVNTNKNTIRKSSVKNESNIQKKIMTERNGTPIKQEEKQVTSGKISAQSELRFAPYDLRYWSILKLLEEERQLNNGRSITFFDDLYQSTGEWKDPDALIKQVLG